MHKDLYKRLLILPGFQLLCPNVCSSNLLKSLKECILHFSHIKIETVFKGILKALVRDVIISCLFTGSSDFCL